MRIRPIAVALAAMLVLAACGSTNGQGASTNSPTEDSSTVTVGIQLFLGLEEAQAAFGATQGASNNQRAAQAIVDYINKNGGVGGRTIKPVFSKYLVTAPEGFEAQAQKTCADFTEDNHVQFAVSGAITGARSLLSCLADRGVPLVNSLGTQYFDSKYYKRYAGYLYEPSLLSASRWGAVIDSLADQDFFGEAAKIGLVRYDIPEAKRAVADAVVPALEAHGLELSEEVAVTEPTSVDATSTTAGQMKNAVLRFRDAGITHVLFMAQQSGPYLFMPEAESQGYHPRYGLTTADDPVFTASIVPAPQLAKALAVSWLPVGDVAQATAVTEGYDGGNASLDRCREILKDAGLSTPDTYALSYCDALFFLKAVLDKAEASTAKAFQAAVNQLSDSFDSPLAIATRFASDRHYGVAAVRPMAFDTGCTCFEYTGPATSVH